MADVRYATDLKGQKNKEESYMFRDTLTVACPDNDYSVHAYIFDKIICAEVDCKNMLSTEPDYLRKCIKTVIYHEPATIVKWKDGTKTVVRCGEYDTYDKEKGLMACIIKKLTGNTGRWNEILKEWCDEDS